MNYRQIIEHKTAAIVAIVGVGLVLLGILLSIVGIDTVLRWQAVDGRVTKAEIRRSRTYTTYGTGSRLRTIGIFEYQYHVAGESYRSRSLDVGLISWLYRLGGIRAVKNHPVGSQLKVYYDPLDPSWSTSSTGIPLEAPVEVLIGLAMIVGAWLYTKERQRNLDLLEEHYSLSWPSAASDGR